MTLKILNVIEYVTLLVVYVIGSLVFHFKEENTFTHNTGNT